MSWAIVSSWSCFCLLHRASPSVAAKNIINLVLILAIWWCPCVESSLVLLEEGVCYDQCVLWQISISLWPASFCIPRPNSPVTHGVSWLPTFAVQSPIMKRKSPLVLFIVMFSVAQLWPTVWDPMDCSLSGSSVHGISQARIPGWVAISSSRGSSQPWDQTWVSCFDRRILYNWATWETLPWC